MGILFVTKGHQKLRAAAGRQELGARRAVILEERIYLRWGIPALECHIIEEAESTPSMIDSRSKRWTRTFWAICRTTSITAVLPLREPKNGNMSIGP